MRFGSNATELTVLRRATGGPDDRGDLAAEFVTWASWTQAVGRTGTAAGQIQDDVDLTVRVNDTPNNRTITDSDRVTLRGTTYAVSSAGLPERKGGYIPLVLKRDLGT